MERRKISIMGVAPAETANDYMTVIMNVDDSNIKIPIIVTDNDAESMLIVLGDKENELPTSHHTFKKMLDILGVEVYEINITAIVEGVFQAFVKFTDIKDDYELEINVSDAILFALNHNCNMYMEKNLINRFGFVVNSDGTVEPIKPENTKNISSVTNTKASIEKLELALQKAIQEEEYEAASQLRDRINEIKNK